MSPTTQPTPAAPPDGDRANEALATETMVGLVSSLADNKAALGQRYGEWGVSAPTLEAAVAAAAMAQDELGHARATYPVVKGLGGDVPEESSFGGEHRLAILDHELPDWTSFIAANLLVDAVLTTFVAACVDSSALQMQQRARKILQEEGSHRVHAEAWGRRLCRSGDEQRRLLLTRLLEFWEHAGRWLGPEDDPGFVAARAHGMVDAGPDAQREQVRVWLVALLAGEDLEITLAAPTDWSDWDRARRRWTR